MPRWRGIKMTHFNSQQMDYIESSIASSIYLEACPGSGKTEVIAAKVAKEINNWTLSPSGPAIWRQTRQEAVNLRSAMWHRNILLNN